MAIRELTKAPRTLELYARAAVPLVPGASRLPWVGGGGGDVPDLELALDGARADRDRLAEYAKVCGFRVRDVLPGTYPHVLAFPLHLALMTDRRFPFPAIGSVHIANRIEVRRPIALDEPLDLRVRATPVRPHPKGRAFSLVTEARVAGELVWDGESTILRRGGGGPGPGGESGAAERAGRGAAAPAPVAAVGEWRLPGDLGRRYAGVSGDQNPIHLHALTARLFGFPRAIAHGMWTKARCLAALEATLPDAYVVEVAFRKPILLPGRVAFGSRREGSVTRFSVRDADRDTDLHLEGSVTT